MYIHDIGRIPALPRCAAAIAPDTDTLRPLPTCSRRSDREGRSEVLRDADGSDAGSAPAVRYTEGLVQIQ